MGIFDSISEALGFGDEETQEEVVNNPEDVESSEGGEVSETLGVISENSVETEEENSNSEEADEEADEEIGENDEVEDDDGDNEDEADEEADEEIGENDEVEDDEDISDLIIADPTSEESENLSSTPAPTVDVVSKLEELSQEHPDLDWRVSIVDLMKLVGLDSSYANRKELAQELGIENYHGTEEQNIELHKTVLAKLAENGGNIPQELLV